MGTSLPKNGNNRPLSLPVGKLSPPVSSFFSFLFPSLLSKALASSFPNYVINRQLPGEVKKDPPGTNMPGTALEETIIGPTLPLVRGGVCIVVECKY